MRRDDGTGPSKAPTQSSGPTPQVTTPISQPLQIMLGEYPSPYMYPNPYMFPFPSPMPGGIARGIVGDLISFLIPIALWDSNTSAVGDANTSALFILLR
ncbi:hypothetical protein Goklo_004369 [Gossypium klotzschianum]|uniref:Uncharacterized protein n=1 Tax=Gossypium klotzschianum TaxID=34286 RepID=A0A7J8VNF8_9ROSI|nr:hypothetical protein [Gossypium klotzschianum]